MRSTSIAFVSGVVLFQFSPDLIRHEFYFAGVPALAATRLRNPIRCIAFLLLGILWAGWRADVALQSRLSAGDEGRIFDVAGYVLTAVNDSPDVVRIRMDLTAVADLRGDTRPLEVLALSWYGRDPHLSQGQYCQLKVRLRRPYGARNPGSFDVERWALVNRIDAVGYVIDHAANRCSGASNVSPMNRLRSTIADAVRSAMNDPSTAAVFSTLAVARRDELSDGQWDVLRKTGTTHLVAISGLHISCVFAALFFLIHAILAVAAPRTRRWAVQPPAAIAAWCGCLFYTGLAGFPISAQRALAMLGFACIAICRRQRVLSFSTLALAMVVIVIVDPFAVLSNGYWLSIVAVASLLFVAATRCGGTRVARAVGVHGFVVVALSPLLAVLFLEIPVTAPVANFIVVPIVTLFVVPLVLVGSAAWFVFPNLATLIWQGAGIAWSGVWAYLSWLARHGPIVELPAAPDVSGLLCAVGVVALVFVPMVYRAWLLLACAAALLVSPRVNDIPDAGFNMTVLDVGQGLAVVVTTKNHALLYDTGPARGESSAAIRHIVPYLRTAGIDRIDRMILSHEDNDHAGGWKMLDERVEIDEIWSNPGSHFLPGNGACVRGRRWIWDAVAFEVVHPPATRASTGNDASCVLRISTASITILLTGDIEAAAEHRLVRNEAARLRANLLISPHHGSDTSSTAAFVAAVRPEFAIHAAGFRNRFGFPHQVVVDRYAASETIQLTTGISGAIEVTVGANDFLVRQFRRDHRRYWHLIPDESRIDLQ